MPIPPPPKFPFCADTMANELQPSGRTRLCRLCLTDKDELYPIFGGAIPDLAEKIYDCTVVEINYIEGIPALICQLCRSKIVVCHQFVESCQRADRKFHRLYGPQFRQHKRFKQELNYGIENHRLNDSSSSSEPKKARVVDRIGDNGKQLALPSKVPAQVAVNPVKPTVVRSLMNDDKVRRQSIVDLKVETVIKRRLSEDSTPEETSIQLIAAKIEQSLKNESDEKLQPGRRKCPTCGLLVRNYQKHKKLHSTIRKHVCGICNKTFTKRCYLTYHANLHSGQNPFKCTECGQGFYSPIKLRDHQRTHNTPENHRREEDKKLQCNVCHQVFSRDTLDKHMSSHQRERNYSCETCGTAYYTRTYLNKHKREVHGWTG